MYEEDLIQVSPTNKESISSFLEELCIKTNKPTFSGGSQRGWSRYQKLQRCPKFYKLEYFSKPKIGNEVLSENLEVGTAFHAFIAMHYSNIWWTPEELKNYFLQSNCELTFVSEAWRLFEHYRLTYVNDYIIPLGVEVTARDSVTSNTCRYDLIAKVKPNGQSKHIVHGLIPDGVYIFEHKTVKQMWGDSIDGWDMDGEIRGEIAFWEKDATIVERYGQLSGLVVNIISRAKKPVVKRVLVAPTTVATKQHLESLQDWTDIEQFYTMQNIWPMALSNCVTKFGRCKFFDYCRNGGV